MHAFPYSRRHCTGRLSMRQRRFSSQRQGENFLTVILVCSPPYARGYVNSYVHVHAFAMCRHVTLDPADCANAQRHQQPQSRVHPDRQRSWGQSFDYGPNMNLFIHFIHYETAIDKFVCNKRFCRKLLDVGYYGDRAIRPHSIHDAHRLPVFLVRALQP